MRSVLAALAMVVSATPAFSHQPTSEAAAVTAPTAAQTAASRFLDAFNAPGSMRDFIAANFTQASLGRESAEQRAISLDRLKAAAGGFTVVEAKPQDERMVEMIAATKNGGRHAKIVLFTSGKEPGKIADIFILAARDPARAAADEFPQLPVPSNSLAAEIERRIDSLAAEDRFSGAVLVARGDRVLVREARGFADQVWRVPNTTDTRFNIASIGKIFTAAAVMRLVEQGKLSLDDTLASRVAAYPHREAAAKITLRHLLTHTAALANGMGANSAADRRAR